MQAWKQLRTPFPGLSEKIQDKFELIFEAAGSPSNMALFCRNDFRAHETIYLLSPAATIFCEAIGGEWESTQPFDFEWIGLVMYNDATYRLNIKLRSNQD